MYVAMYLRSVKFNYMTTRKVYVNFVFCYIAEKNI